MSTEMAMVSTGIPPPPSGGNEPRWGDNNALARERWRAQQAAGGGVNVVNSHGPGSGAAPSVPGYGGGGVVSSHGPGSGAPPTAPMGGQNVPQGNAYGWHRRNDDPAGQSFFIPGKDKKNINGSIQIANNSIQPELAGRQFTHHGMLHIRIDGLGTSI